jgi:hypothetical protein
MIHSLEDVRSALQTRLGRSPSVRQVIGREHFYIQDPLTSHVQRGDHKFPFDYRNGLLVDLEAQDCYFSLVHCPAIARHIKKNFDISTLFDVLDRISCWCDEYALGWSSVMMQSDFWIVHRDYATFRHQILDFESAHGLKKDLFYGLDKRRHRNPKARKGNFFSLRLGTLERIGSADELIDAAMPIFGWCLPSEEHPGRVASLAASLAGAGIAKICEFSSILDAPEHFYATECTASIEGAHIRPHAKGGSAASSNGLWLCSLHHRLSEGKVMGQRDRCTWQQNRRNEQ